MHTAYQYLQLYACMSASIHIAQYVCVCKALDNEISYFLLSVKNFLQTFIKHSRKNMHICIIHLITRALYALCSDSENASFTEKYYS